MTKDLVQGPPFQCIIRFTLPIFLGMLFQQFYNMVDTMIVGKFLGLDPLAGVGATSPLYFLVIGSCTGICSGFSIPIAHMFGAKDQVALRKLVANSAYLSVVISVIVTTVTLICCKPMLTVMDTPSDAYPYAYMYIGVIFAGIPFTILYNMTASIIRALGDSKTYLLC